MGNQSAKRFRKYRSVNSLSRVQREDPRGSIPCVVLATRARENKKPRVSFVTAQKKKFNRNIVLCIIDVLPVGSADISSSLLSETLRGGCGEKKVLVTRIYE